MNEILGVGLKMGLFLHVVAVSPSDATLDESLLHCEGLNNQSYVCESGHCCGESQCCSYYYELWWFWLVWVIIFILSCCCVCHHRRTKHRLQQLYSSRHGMLNSSPLFELGVAVLFWYGMKHSPFSCPRLQETLTTGSWFNANLATCFPCNHFQLILTVLYVSLSSSLPGFLPNSLLPDYEEVVNRPPTPPPPYSVFHTVSPMPTDPQDGLGLGHCPSIQTTPVPPVSDTLCSRRSLEEPHCIGAPTISYNRHKADNKPQEPQDGGPGLGPQEASTEEPRGPEKSCKEPLLLGDLGGPESGAQEDKDNRGALGRRRRFTGDSGIEVCVCDRGGSTSIGSQEGKELREKDSLMGEEVEEQEGGDFCDGCGHPAPGVEEELALDGPESRSECGSATGSTSLPPPAMTQPTQPPVCLLLHTINELEGPPHHGNSTEPQG
ncbi:WW domain binding protein 1-like [Oncorhynchus tshawytscha]|uniref:WW domain binding protein 1-like n=1 Tax=Oncorhynchus tshawytscha TaxID=74940 RepID=UPI001C3D8EB9|nr:WW domain binding protein 1-like [Oncorhynchus tshawytscha]